MRIVTPCNDGTTISISSRYICIRSTSPQINVTTVGVYQLPSSRCLRSGLLTKSSNRACLISDIVILNMCVPNSNRMGLSITNCIRCLNCSICSFICLLRVDVTDLTGAGVYTTSSISSSFTSFSRRRLFIVSCRKFRVISSWRTVCLCVLESIYTIPL